MDVTDPNHAIDRRVLDAHFTDPEAHAIALTAYYSGYPVAYLTQTAAFFDQLLAVYPGVLIPRPETECLVSCVPDILASTLVSMPDYIVDVGYGSGCIALALAKQFPNAVITGFDTNYRAYRTACENKDRYSADTIQFHWADFFNAASSVQPAFASMQHRLIISNPPYIDMSDPMLSEDVYNFEPISALDGGKNGLDFIRELIITVADWHHKFGGKTMVLLEIGYNQATAVSTYFEQSGYTDCQRYTDYAGYDRVIGGALVS